MKILFINSVYRVGSTGRLIEIIVRKAKENNDECLVCYGYTKKPQEEAFRISNGFDIRFHNKLSYFTGKHGHYSSFSTLRLLRKIKKFRPDIVHLHNLHGGYINIPMLLGYLARNSIPVVYTLHDCWAFTGKCTHFTLLNCRKWENAGCADCPALSLYPKSRVDLTGKEIEIKNSLYRNLSHIQITAVSEWLCGVAKKSILGKYDIEFIPNCIDTQTFCYSKSDFREKYNLSDKIMLLGVASIWNDSKGLSRFTQLSEKLPNNYVIVLCGLSDAQIQALKEYKNIVGLGKISSAKELAKIYSAADCYINLSLEETFGLTSIEAMACGTPAIAIDSTACAETISEDTGAVLAHWSADDLISLIPIVLEKGNKYYREKCPAYVDEKYSEQTVVSRYLALYRKVFDLSHKV